MASQKREMAPEAIASVEKGAFRRRGLIAGAAALAAGVLATRMGSEAVDAADGVAILQGAASNANNTAATLTTLTAPTTVAVFRAMQAAVAVPDTSLDASQGFATGANNSGVHGRNDALNGIGTTGVATNGTGVYGQSTSGSGVGAVSSSGYGVYATSGSGTGVYGQSASGTGVFGTTTSGLYGVAGISGTASGSAGLVGVATGPNAVAFGTIVQGGATFAGYFNGTTVVNGAFAVTGSKSAAVKDASGQYRLMYSVESPEAWFEDFGTGTLVNGKATVKLDPQFAQHIHTDQYHVFISEDGDHNGLHTTAKNTSGFTVEASSLLAKAAGVNAAQAQGSFSWRVVAKRNDIKGERLATFAMPPKLTLAAPTPPASGVAPLPKRK
jgi:hypothetical protein